jgi:phage terminase small subunit
MSEDFVFGSPTSEVIPPTQALVPTSAAVDAQAVSYRRDKKKCVANHDALKAMYENTRVPVPVLAAQYDVQVKFLRAYALAEKWTNPRTTDEDQQSGPVVDPGFDENGKAIKQLTEQQRLLVEEYLKDPTFNKSAAARAAGFATKAAFNAPSVQAAIETAIAERAERNNMTADDVLEELERLAKANMSDYVSWDEAGNVKFVPSDRLTADQKAGIISISQGRSGTKIELAKIAAVKMLGQHLGMFVERIEADHRVAVIMTEIDADL